MPDNPTGDTRAAYWRRATAHKVPLVLQDRALHLERDLAGVRTACAILRNTFRVGQNRWPLTLGLGRVGPGDRAQASSRHPFTNSPLPSASS